MKRSLCLTLLVCMLISLLSGGAHAAENITLTVAGDMTPADAFSAFAREHPEIQIVESDVYDSATLIQDAMSHSDAVDVYFMYTLLSSTYENLRDRGYFLELSDPELLAMADSIYPELREAALYNGALCALPFIIQGQPTLAVDLDCWEALGLAEDELPSTWAEALRFMLERWPELSRDHSDIGLFTQSYAELFLRSIENNYEAHRSKCGYEMGYDTEEFREILNLFSQLSKTDAFSDEDAEEYERFLFWNDYIPSVRETHDRVRALRLSFRENDAPCYAVGYIVMAINPNSKHIDEAIALTEYVFENNGAMEMLEICPAWNEPVIDEIYEEEQSAYAAQMEAYAAMLANTADESERRAIEMERDAYAQAKQDFFAAYKYAASPESIQRYREEVEGIMVPIYETGISQEEYQAVNETRITFLNGQISADQYIRELERRFVFASLEGR